MGPPLGTKTRSKPGGGEQNRRACSRCAGPTARQTHAEALCPRRSSRHLMKNGPLPRGPAPILLTEAGVGAASQTSLRPHYLRGRCGRGKGISPPWHGWAAAEEAIFNRGGRLSGPVRQGHG